MNTGLYIERLISTLRLWLLIIAANSPYSRPMDVIFLLPRSSQSLGHGLRLRYSARMKIWPLALLTLCLTAAASAKPWWMRGVESNETDFLPPDVAFRVDAGVDGHLVRVRWVIADGYYLYRRKIEIKAESPDLNVAAPQLPQGTMKVDPYLGTQEIYQQQVEATAAYSRFD